MAPSRVESNHESNRQVHHLANPIGLERNTSAATQAFRALHSERIPRSFCAQDCIDPLKTINPARLPLFGQDILLTSSQMSQSQDEIDPSLTLGLPASNALHEDFTISSTDEDADGEPDESFHSEQSFWSTHPADISASTAATMDDDEPPIPLLGRDGTWKGVSPSKAAMRDDNQNASHGRDAGRSESRTFKVLDGVSELALISDVPPRQTRRKRGASVSSHGSSGVPRSAVKKQKKGKGKQKAEESGSSKPGARTKRTPKKTPPKPKTPKKPAQSTPSSSRLTRSQVPSSEIGHSDRSGMSTLSSPASGRYKLRKKESVPRLDLAALLTPPRDTPPRNQSIQSRNEAADRSADWLGELDESHHLDEPATLEAAAIQGSSSAALAEATELKQESSFEASLEIDELENSLPDIRFVTPRDRGQRTFPRHWEVHPEFPLLYQRYHVPSSVSPEVLEMLLRGVNFADADEEFHLTINRAQSVHGAFNKPRSILDLYTPRFVKGVGPNKVGMCPVCYEEGRVNFLKTKFSAYNYHLQNFHGISALTCLPFIPPTHFRTKQCPNRKPKERKEIVQGHCYSCKKWVDMQGPKDTDVKVAEIYWWKHAQACHRKGAKMPEGVGGWFVEGLWYRRVCSVLELVGGVDGEVRKLVAGNK